MDYRKNTGPCQLDFAHRRYHQSRNIGKLHHSCRDFAINSYFLEHFVQEEIQLYADQKTDVWSREALALHVIDDRVRVGHPATGDGERPGRLKIRGLLASLINPKIHLVPLPPVW